MHVISLTMNIFHNKKHSFEALKVVGKPSNVSNKLIFDGLSTILLYANHALFTPRSDCVYRTPCILNYSSVFNFHAWIWFLYAY